jgi:hypothetical protein
MTLVSPVLKWVIYPSIGKSMRQNWERNFPIEKDKRDVEFLPDKRDVENGGDKRFKASSPRK